MDDEPEVIRQQMEETRSSLTDKIERLEQAVTAKVQNTTAAVTDTVESVKEAVHATVETVKGTVSDTVESVKQTFDVGRYFRESPWAAFGISVGAGFIGGRLLSGECGARKTQDFGRLSQSGPPSHNGARREGVTPNSSSSNEPSKEPRTGWAGNVASKFEDEIGQLKGLAVGTAFGLLRAFMNRSVPAPLSEQVGEIIDSATRKLGGHPLRGDLLETFQGWGGRGKVSGEKDTRSEARSADRAGVV